MEFTDRQLTELHELCNERHPGWTLSSWQRALHKLPDGTPWAQLIARADRLADDPRIKSPGALPAYWDKLATTRAADRPQPTDPVEQSARLSTLVGGVPAGLRPSANWIGRLREQNGCPRGKLYVELMERP